MAPSPWRPAAVLLLLAVAGAWTVRARADDGLPPGATARLGSPRFRVDSAVQGAALSPDGATLAASAAVRGQGHQLSAWNAATGEPRFRVPLPASARRLEFSPDGKLLAVGCGDGILLFRVADGSAAGRVPRRENGGYQDFAFTAGGAGLVLNGNRLVPAGTSHFNEGVVRLWDVAAGKQRWAVGTRFVGWSAAASPDGRAVFSGDYNGEVRRHDAADGAERYRARPRAGAAEALAVSPDGRTLAVRYRGAVALCDAATGKTLAECRYDAGDAGPAVEAVRPALAFTPDSRELVLAGRGGAVRVFDARTGREARAVPGRCAPGGAAALSGDGATLAWAAGDKVSLWDAKTGRSRGPDAGHHGAVTALAAAPDGRTLVSAGLDGVARVWDAAAGRQVAAWPLPGRRDPAERPGALRLSPDGRTAAVVLREGVFLRDLPTGAAPRKLPLPTPHPDALAFSHDGARFAAVNGDRAVVAESATARVVTDFGLQRSDSGMGVTSVAFLPGDGLLAVSRAYPPFASMVRAEAVPPVELYEAATGRPKGSPGGLLGGVWSLTVSARGELVGTAEGPRGALVVWGPRGRRGPRRAAEDADRGKPRAVAVSGLGPLGPLGRYAVAVSPDGRLAAGFRSAGADTVLVYEVATDREVGCLPRLDRDNHFPTVAFTGDGRLATGEADGTILLWDVYAAAGADVPAGGPTDAGRESAWAALAGQAAEAFRAAARLRADPDAAVRFLGDKLPPATPADPAALARLAADLDDERFAVRQAAEEKLARLGVAAGEALRAMRDRAGPEGRRRAVRLLDALDADLPPPEALREDRALGLLEYLGTPGARKLLGELARGDPAAPRTKEAAACVARLSRRANGP